MEDFLLAILGAIFEVFGEALCELLLGEIIALIARALRRFRVTLRRSNPVLAGATLALLGIGIGFLSVLALPYPLVHPSKVHGISLLISPLVAGLMLGYVGRVVHRRGRIPVRIESFSYGFLFAFPFALIRLLLTH